MASGGGKGSKKAPAKARAASGKSSRSRSRKSASSKKGSGAAAAASSSSSGALSPTLAAAAAASAVVPPAPSGPTPTLILDTGGWTVKHGLVTVTPPLALPSEGGKSDAAVQPPTAAPPSSAAAAAAAAPPRQSPNVTARPHHQLTVLCADEIHSVKNHSQLVVTRPLERGYATDLGAQLRVWRRVCDVEGVDAVPSAAGGPLDPAVANLLGMGPAASAAAKKKRRAGAGGGGGGALPAMSPPPPTHVSRDCAAMVLTQPFTPRTVSERVDEIWFRDLGFARVGRRLVQTMAAHRYLSGLRRKRARAEARAAGAGASSGGGAAAADDDADGGDFPPWDDDRTECCLIVDSGFSLTHVVPTVSARAVSRGVRRLNVGGKFLTNLLKEAVSYRQWNMMDEFQIVNEAKEALCYVSADFDAEMRGAAGVRPGWREFDREFVLPDFLESFEGVVRLPEPLRRKKEMEEAAKMAAEAKESRSKDKEARKETKENRREKSAEEDKGGGGSDEEAGSGDGNEKEGGGDSDDSDEETDDQRRARILRQREEERRRREAEEASRQVLSLSVERFAVPEALFRPTDVGLEQGGVAEAAVQAVEACAPHLRAALLRNVVVVGGNARMPGFRERFEGEVRRLAPARYEVRTWTPDDPVGYAWRGAREFTTAAAAAGEDAFRTCFVDRVEWEASRRNPKEQWNVWAKLEEKHTAEGMMIM